MTFTSIPTVGKDANGTPVNLITNSSGQALVAANPSTIGTPSTAWQKTEVDTLVHTSAGTIGIGYGIDPNGLNQSLLWANTGGVWKIGPATLSHIRPNGITNNGSTWLIADGTNIYSTDFNLKASGPASQLAALAPIYTPQSNVAIPVDGLSTMSTITIGTSLNTVGSWTPNVSIPNFYDHNVGESVPVATGHKKTSYTFPGYSASNPQIQFANAVPLIDPTSGQELPPTAWNTTTGNEVGYFGVTGSPTITVSWT